MDPLSLFAILIGIIVISKIIAHGIRVVDVLMYIVFGFIFAKFNIIDAKNEVLYFLSEIGVLFLMFYAGWHEDSKTFISKVIKNKWIAIIGAIGPFLGAYFGTKILGFTFNESVVAGFVFTATAVPYTIAVLQSLKLDKTPAAKSIVAAAMADDFISIISMSAVFSTFILIQSGKNINTSEIILGVGLKLLLLILCFAVFIFLATIIFPENKQEEKQAKGYKKLFHGIINVFGLKWFTKKFHKVEIVVPTIFFLMIFLSYFAHFMGLHAAIGAYLTGLILNKDMFHHDDEGRSITNVIYSLANHFLGPIFFISLGASLVIDFNNFKEIFFNGLLLFIFVGVMQFISAYLASKYTANLSNKDSVLVGLGMWPRDVLAFVILGIAINSGIITENSIFGSVIVITIILLDITSPILISYWASKYSKKEKNL